MATSSAQQCRPLDPEYVKLIIPSLPAASADAGFSFSREKMEQSMNKMKEAKDASLAKYWPHLKDGVKTEQFAISMRDGVSRDIRVYTPATNTTSGPRRVLYTIHGGGFVAGNIDSEDLINRQQTYENDVVTFSIDHRLAPESPIFPVICNDTEDGLKWVAQNASKYGGDISKGIFLSGTSSGGFLVSRLAFLRHKLGVPVEGVIMRQPVFILCDLDSLKDWKPELEKSKSRDENRDCPGMNKSVVDSLTKLLKVTPEMHRDVDSFNIFASKEQLANMPPTYIVHPTVDPGADDMVIFKDKLVEAGVPVTLATYEGLPHGFHAYHVLSAARQEMKDTAKALENMIKLSGGSSQ